MVGVVLFFLLGNLFLIMRDRERKKSADNMEHNPLKVQRQNLTRARNSATQMDLVTIRTQTIAFSIDKGRMPNDLQELCDEGFYSMVEAEDKFGRDLKSGIEEGMFFLRSSGQDGIWNTRDDLEIKVHAQ